MNEKKWWDVYHEYEVDGGFGDSVSRDDKVATVFATEKEIDDFVKKWDNPRVYYVPYAELTEHHVYAVESEIVDLANVIPYEDDHAVFFEGLIKLPDGREETEWFDGECNRNEYDMSSSIERVINYIEKYVLGQKVTRLYLNGHLLNELEYMKDFVDFGVKDQDTVYLSVNCDETRYVEVAYE